MISFEEFKARFPQLRDECTEEELAAGYRDLLVLADIGAELALRHARSNSDQEGLDPEPPEEVR